jgi:hypothetical protein
MTREPEVCCHRYQQLNRDQEVFQNISGGVSGLFSLVTANL